MTDLIKRHGAGGELSPAIGAMVDLAKYGQGWATQRNMLTNRSGVPENRPGLSYVASTKFPSKVSRLIPFVFSNAQSYMLEFGEGYIRFYQNGAPILVSNVAAYDSSVSYIPGALVSSGGVNYYCIASTTGNAPPNATFWYALTGNIYEIPTPYLEADLATIFRFQSLDIAWILHPSYRPALLNRFGQTNWTYAPNLFLPGQDPINFGVSVAAGAVGTNALYYKVTSLNLETGEESFAGITGGTSVGSTFNILGASFVTFNYINFLTSAPHGLNAGQLVSFACSWLSGAQQQVYVTAGSYYTVTNVLSPTLFRIGPVVNYPPVVPQAGDQLQANGLAQVTVLIANVMQNITGITATFPAKIITQSAHGWSTGTEVRIDGTGITQLDKRVFVINKTSNTSFQLIGVDSTNYDPWPAAHTGQVCTTVASVLSAQPTETFPNTISWTTALQLPQGTAVSFRIYGSTDGVTFGYLGSAYGNSYPDIGLPPDYTQQPPLASYAFLSPNNYPAVGTIYQDRAVLAKTNNQKCGVWASQISHYNNFGIRLNPQDDDSIQFNLLNDNGSEIQGFIEVGLLLIMTNQRESMIFGDPSGAFIPSAINARSQAFNGSTGLSPLTFNKNALFVQARGSQVRDLQLQTTFYTFIQGSDDLSQFAQHLLDGFTIQQWAAQKIYNSIAWMVRNDGTLLGLTYIKEQDIIAWHHHDTLNGFFEDVSVIPENGEDAVYVTVRRVINGQTVRFIERMNTVVVSDLKDCKFADAGSAYDGRNITTMTMTLSGGTTWSNTETLTLTSSSDFFTGADAGGILGGGGNEIQFPLPDGTNLRFRIWNFLSPTQVTGKVQKTVPVAFQNAAITNWAKGIFNLIGLDYLEGQNIGVLADGFEVANPLDIKKPVITVTNGMATLPYPAAVIYLGLPITADLQTLNYDSPQGETVSDKKMTWREVGVKVMSSQSFFIARAFPPSTDTNPVGTGQNRMIEAKVRTTEPLGVNTYLQTQLVPVKIPGKYDMTGQVALRHIRMTPLTVLAFVLAGDLPESSKGGTQ